MSYFPSSAVEASRELATPIRRPVRPFAERVRSILHRSGETELGVMKGARGASVSEGGDGDLADEEELEELGGGVVTGLASVGECVPGVCRVFVIWGGGTRRVRRICRKRGREGHGYRQGMKTKVERSKCDIPFPIVPVSSLLNARSEFSTLRDGNFACIWVAEPVILSVFPSVLHLPALCLSTCNRPSINRAVLITFTTIVLSSPSASENSHVPPPIQHHSV